MAMKLFVLAVLAVAASPLASAALADIDKAVLNFALNLEYLEANFYSCVAFGKPIDKSLWGKGGVAPKGCKKGKLSTWGRDVATEIANDEIAHVRVLRSVLGADAVDQPELDIGAAFAAAANAAASLGLNKTIVLKPAFDPYANEVFFFHGAFIFEDVGVTAYAGAAALIVDKAYLTAAAQILAVEAYHAGAVRFQLARIMNKKSPFTFPPDVPIRTVVQLISDLRDAVDGSDDIDQGVANMVTDSHGKSRYVWNIVPSDANGLVFLRNTNQVLRIVYLGGSSKGGFFPKGLNGAIKEVSE